MSKPNVGSIQEFNYVGDGVTTTYDTIEVIGSKAEVLVFVNNIYQDTAVYSISNNQVIFDEAPYEDDRITLLHIATIIVSNVATTVYVDEQVDNLQDEINNLTTYVNNQIQTVSNTATDDAIAFAIALG